MAVRGLGLLEPIDSDSSQECNNSKYSNNNEEEEEFFASLQGMEEEIQMMAILGRAASLRDRTDWSKNDNDDVRESGGEDGMEQINSMMKCTAMLMFHIVLMASAPSDDARETKDTTDDKDVNATKSAAGFDGRVRHVLKMSCVDVLTRAILQSVDAYEKEQQSQSEEVAHQETSQTKVLYDIDEVTLWNIPNIKTFVEEHVIGKEAIFGTVWHKQSSEKFALLGKKQGSTQQLVDEKQNDDKLQQEQQQEEGEQQQSDEFPSIEEMHSDLLLTDETDEEESAVSESEDRIEADPIKEDKISDETAEQSVDPGVDDNDSKQNLTSQQSDNAIDSNETEEHELNQVEFDHEHQLQLQQQEKETQQAKRQLNAKFLASRKYELIERIVAIDVVRFLMAEERERKLREKEQKNKFMNVVEMLKKATEEESGQDVQDSVDGESSEARSDGNDQNQNGEDVPSESASYWTSHRKKQALRSLKIAGVGLT